MSARAFIPVIIVGAGRSGTNMLRDALVRLPGFATWDCDEINPVWRHGHFFRSDDELRASDLTAGGRRVIAKSFQSVLKRHPGARYVVEKTCANSLRLPYVDAALDDARFIQIVRDGRDVVPSAAKRWRGELEVGGKEYFIAKARHTPPTDLPLYAASFAWTRLRKLVGLSDRLSSWGPRYKGMEAHLDEPLDQICARQWAACVDKADAYLETLPTERWMRVRYEDFVADPQAHVEAIAKFLGTEATQDEIAAATQAIRGGNIGKGRKALSDGAESRLTAIMSHALSRHGYAGVTL